MTSSEFKKNFKIYSHFAPTVFTSHLSGKKWAIAIGSPWIEIPSDMTQQEVHAGWVKLKKEEVKPQFEQVVISRKKEFVVQFTDKWKCSCSSYKSKKTCLHIEQVKSELKTKFKK